MERFSVFADASVGVNPFTVQQVSRSFGQALCGALLFFLKAPLIAIAFVSLFVSDALPIAAARAPFVRLWAGVLLKLFGLSVLDVTLRYNELFPRPGPPRAAPKGPATPAPVRPGDVIVSNHASWVDVLLLASRFAPEFAVSSRAGSLQRASLRQALRHACGTAPASLPACSSDSSAAAAKSTAAVLASAWAAQRAPLALLSLEGAPTNGRAILTLTPLAEQVAEAVAARKEGGERGQQAVHCVGLRYSPPLPGRVSAAFVAGSAWAHARLLASATHQHAVGIMRASSGFDHQPADYAAPGAAGASSSAPSSAPAGAPTSWPAAVRLSLSQLCTRGNGLRVECVSLGADRHAEFAAMVAASQA